MVKILKFLNINCAIGIFSPRHNQTMHFPSERAALWHPGTSLSTSSFLCVSKNIARIAKAALHNLAGKSSLNLYMGIEKIYIYIFSYPTDAGAWPFYDFCDPPAPWAQNSRQKR